MEDRWDNGNWLPWTRILGVVERSRSVFWVERDSPGWAGMVEFGCGIEILRSCILTILALCEGKIQDSSTRVRERSHDFGAHHAPRAGSSTCRARSRAVVHSRMGVQTSGRSRAAPE